MYIHIIDQLRYIYKQIDYIITVTWGLCLRNPVCLGDMAIHYQYTEPHLTSNCKCSSLCCNWRIIQTLDVTSLVLCSVGRCGLYCLVIIGNINVGAIVGNIHVGAIIVCARPLSTVLMVVGSRCVDGSGEQVCTVLVVLLPYLWEGI